MVFDEIMFRGNKRNLFDCHWGLPSDYVGSNSSVQKSINEIQELCSEMDGESWIYVYFSNSNNRICITQHSVNLWNVDLQYSDPICEGAVSISELGNILKNYIDFQKEPEKYGITYTHE